MELSGDLNGRHSIRDTIRSKGGGGSDAPGVFIWPLHPWHLDIRLLMNFRVNGPGDGSFVVGSG